MRVLISGCGYVGSALGLLLSAEGHTVFGLRRNPDALPPAIRPIRADLSKPLPPDTLPPNLDAAVHAASPNRSSDEAYELAYTQGPQNLLSALEPQPLKRLILVSSTGVYGQKNGEWVDEESPTKPETTSGKRLLEGERLVLGGPFPATILRLGGIYGPGRTGAIERALSGAPEEDPPRYTNRIHRDDCAGALRHLLLTLPNPGPIYLGVDHEPATRSIIAEWLVSRPDARLDETATPARNTPRDESRDAPRSRSNKRCNNARLVHSGYRFRYPTFREGFAALLPETPAPPA